MIQAVWVEIPVKDLERAMQFYQALFGPEATEVVTDEVRRTSTLCSGSQEGSPGISLNETKNFEPSDRGPWSIWTRAGI